MADVNQSDIIVSPNPLGRPIRADQIEGILNPSTLDEKDLRKRIAYFFGLKEIQLDRELLEKYAKACTCMGGVRMGAVDYKIYNKLIYNLASAKKCYSYNEIVACIEMCASYAEMLCIYLCVVSKERLFSGNVISLVESSDKKLYDQIRSVTGSLDIFDAILQLNRIAWLKIAKVLSEKEFGWLEDVYTTRRQYYHQWSKSFDEIDEDALRCLGNMSKLASHHFELFSDRDSINKIKEYNKDFSAAEV